MAKIENTARTASENPALTLLQMMGPNPVERQETAGQRQLLASEVLPAASPYGSDNGDADYIALGFTFGAPVEGDPLFRHATLPQGWKREGSDHAMWSYIVDERGIQRVGVFYKAAFYDRRADMHIINVGRDLATHAIYGTDPITRDTLKLDALTATERADLVATVAAERKKIQDDPTYYGQYLPNVEACEKALS